jgi:hypothetical protein
VEILFTINVLNSLSYSAKTALKNQQHICYKSSSFTSVIPLYASILCPSSSPPPPPPPSRIMLLGFFRFRIYFVKLMNLFGQLVGLLGRGIGPTQGLYLHRTTQHRKTRTPIQVSNGIRTHNPSVLTAEDGKCLRPLGPWERLQCPCLPILRPIRSNYTAAHERGRNAKCNRLRGKTQSDKFCFK